SAFANQVANNHESRSDANTNLEPHFFAGTELWDRLSQFESRPYSSFRVILVCLGITEVSENAVAHELGHESTRLGDLLGAAAVVRAHHLPQVFGIET